MAQKGVYSVKTEDTEMHEKIEQIMNALEEFFGPEVEAKAKETGFVQRDSKMTGLQFIKMWVIGFLEKPIASLNYLAQVSADLGVEITKQGIQERLSTGAVEFMKAMLQRCSTHLQNKVPIDLALLKQFCGIQIVDSSGFGLPDSLQEEFPGSGGDGPMAGIKFQTMWDFLSGNLLSIVTQDGKQSDQAFRDHTDQMLAGWLCLSDLGYFSLEALERMINKQAYFISRWLTGCGLFLPENQTKFDFLAFLRTSHQDKLELNLLVGANSKIPCRLLAIRLPENVVQAKHKRLRNTALKKGRKVSAESLDWAKWTIFVTNVPQAMLSFEQVALIYRLRWQIELMFKLWKSECQIDYIAGSTKSRILCEIYAKLIGAILFQYISSPCRWGEHELSPTKALQTFRRFVMEFGQALHDRSKLEKCLTKLFKHWQRYAMKDHHLKQLSTCQQIALASSP